MSRCEGQTNLEPEAWCLGGGRSGHLPEDKSNASKRSEAIQSEQSKPKINGVGKKVLVQLEAALGVSGTRKEVGNKENNTKKAVAKYYRSGNTGSLTRSNNPYG